MMIKNTIAQIALLLQATQMVAGAFDPPNTYTLADFGMESVEPGLTLLTPDYGYPFIKSKTHLNAPQLINKHLSGFPPRYEYGTFETVVGPIMIPPRCTVDRDETGWIVAEKAACGCSYESQVRMHMEAGALGFLSMSGMPVPGVPSQAWEWSDTSDIDDFPNLTTGGFIRPFWLAEIAAGNETVVAFTPGDLNANLEYVKTADWIFRYSFGNIINLCTLIFAIYLRKLMYELAPKSKKNERTLATTSVEIEILMAIFRFTFSLDCWVMHVIAYRWTMHMRDYNKDLSFFTTVLLLIYWNSLTGKKMSKGTVFLNKRGVIAASIVIVFLLTLSSAINYAQITYDSNWSDRVLGLNISSLSGTIHTYISMSVTIAYLYFGGKFLIHLRNSGSSKGSMDEGKKKVFKRIATFMMVSIFFNGLWSWYTAYVTGPGSNYAYFMDVCGRPIGSLTAATIMTFISFSQLYCFGVPVLRRKQEELAASKASTGGGSSSSSESSKNTSSSGASSSAVSSSGVSSSGV